MPESVEAPAACRHGDGRGTGVSEPSIPPGKALETGDIIRAYRRMAPVYDQTFGRIVARGRREAVRQVGGAPQRLLELGVGTGISLPMYPPGVRVVGVDLSPDMLAIARRRVEDQRLHNVEAILEMDAEALAFPDAAFDTVVAMYVLTVVTHPLKVMGEMRRVTRPGGRVLVVSHFSAERGLRALGERLVAPLGTKLGWRPAMPQSEIVPYPGLDLVSRRTLSPFGLFTLLEFRRVPEGPVIS